MSNRHEKDDCDRCYMSSRPNNYYKSRVPVPFQICLPQSPHRFVLCTGLRVHPAKSAQQKRRSLGIWLEELGSYPSSAHSSATGSASKLPKILHKALHTSREALETAGSVERTIFMSLLVGSRCMSGIVLGSILQTPFTEHTCEPASTWSPGPRGAHPASQ